MDTLLKSIYKSKFEEKYSSMELMTHTNGHEKLGDLNVNQTIVKITQRKNVIQ